jgi:hypothetical protein
VGVALGAIGGGGGAITGGAAVGVAGWRRKLSAPAGASCALAGAAAIRASAVPDSIAVRQFMPVVAPTTSSRPLSVPLAGGG